MRCCALLLGVLLVGCVTEAVPDEGRFKDKDNKGQAEQETPEQGVTATTSGGDQSSSTGGAGGSGGAASTSSSSGVTTGGGGADTSCQEHSQCANHEFCEASACAPAWGRTFRITIVEATVPPTKPDSMDAWDINNGAPDPFVIAYDGESVLATSSTKDNTFEPVWNEAIDVVFQHGADNLSLVIADEDIADHDFIGGTTGDHQDWLNLMKDYGTVQLTEADGLVYILDISPL